MTIRPRKKGKSQKKITLSIPQPIQFCIAITALRRDLPESVPTDLSRLLREQQPNFRYGKEALSQVIEGSEFLTLVRELSSHYASLIWKHAILVHPLYQTKKMDFTFYLKRDSEDGADDCIEQLLKHKAGEVLEKQPSEPPAKKRPANQRKLSFDCRLTIYDKDKDKKEPGRVLACACFEGEYWSLTFRGEEESSYKLEDSPPKKYKATYQSSTKPKAENLNIIPEIGDTLYKLIFPDKENQKVMHEYDGLVVVTGRTASAKSLIIRQLIYDYLDKRKEYFKESVKRRPHLLTFEDPVEKYYFKDPESKESIKNPCIYQDYGIDYTPRQLHKDAADLKSVLNDALRQTPAVVYVGETRSDKEWELLVNFAGTGHLIFTTAHAGSLSEAMGKIINGMGEETPARRSALADRLLAVVHVQHTKVADKVALVPNLWRRTPNGAKAFMSEGRASLLPHYCGKEASIGRTWFADQFLKKASVGLSEEDKAKFYKAHNHLLGDAVEWDLEGM